MVRMSTVRQPISGRVAMMERRLGDSVSCVAMCFSRGFAM